MKRRTFIQAAGAVITSAFAPAIATAKANPIQKVMRQVNGAKQVIYSNDKAVAMFCYRPDGAPGSCSITSKEDFIYSMSLYDDPEGWLNGYLKAWSGEKYERLITTTWEHLDDEHHKINGFWEMTEDNVDYYLENYEDSSSFVQSATALDPEYYQNWHDVENSMPFQDFGTWTRKAYGEAYETC